MSDVFSVVVEEVVSDRYVLVIHSSLSRVYYVFFKEVTDEENFALSFLSMLQNPML